MTMLPQPRALPSPWSQDPDDLALLAGMTVDDNDDDDPTLIYPDGRPVETWREDYPYGERLPRHEYEHTKRLLQIELLKLQNWIKETGQKLVIVFEGRDAAGKGGTIKRFRSTSTRAARPWSRWRSRTSGNGPSGTSSVTSIHLPAAGEIVMFDRSWYNRAGVERVMGFCTPAEYLEFMRQAPDVERMLVRCRHRT